MLDGEEIGSLDVYIKGKLQINLVPPHRSQELSFSSSTNQTPVFGHMTIHILGS